jgi:putative oxidoreductase
MINQAAVSASKNKGMNITQKISQWGDLHHPKILDSIRMLLGIFLLAKGISFLNNAAYLRYLIIENKAIRQSPEIIRVLIVYVTYIHLVGGSLIFWGYLHDSGPSCSYRLYLGQYFL